MSIKHPKYQYYRHSNLSYPSGLHRHCEIIAVSSGEMNLIVNKTKITLSAGNGIFIPGYINHGFETSNDSVCHIWEYDESLISEEFSRNICSFKIPVKDILYLDSANDTNNILTCKAIIYFIASHFCSENALIHNVEINDICSKTALFIAENYDKNITLKEAADYCNVSYAYLSKIFQKNIGITFTKCLNNTRIGKCLYMLADSDIPITDIAMLCGFNTLRNFNRVFFQEMGCTPVEYRNYIRNK